MEGPDGSFIEAVKITGSTSSGVVAHGDETHDMEWEIKGSEILVPAFGLSGTVQANGNIHWSNGAKAVISL